MIVNDNGHLINMAPYRNLFIILGETILLRVGRDFFCYDILCMDVIYKCLMRPAFQNSHRTALFLRIWRKIGEREQGKSKGSQAC